MHNNTILRTAIFFMIPILLSLAFYIQLNGDFTPGGGFQAGVLLALPFILISMLYGTKKLLSLFPLSYMKFIASLGIFIYGFTGFIPMLHGKTFLDYSFILTNSSSRHLGILLIEIGVGLTVFSAMIIIYTSFAKKLEDHKHA